MDTLLGAIDYRSAKGDSIGVTHSPPFEVVEAVLNAGAVPIPAHVEANKGLLRVRGGGSRKPERDAGTIRQILANQNIHAMEVADRTVPKAALYDDAKADWCEVLGSDCHSFPWRQRTRNPLHVGQDGDSVSRRTALGVDGRREILYSTQRRTAAGHAARALRGSHRDRQCPVHGARSRLPGSSSVRGLTLWSEGVAPASLRWCTRLRIAARREGDLANLKPESEPRSEFDRFKRVPEHRRDTGGLRGSTRITWTVMRDGVRHRVRWPVKDGVTIVEEETVEGGWRQSPSEMVSPERFPIRISVKGRSPPSQEMISERCCR